jgi:hypothetical protein
MRHYSLKLGLLTAITLFSLIVHAKKLVTLWRVILKETLIFSLNPPKIDVNFKMTIKYVINYDILKITSILKRL